MLNVLDVAKKCSHCRNLTYHIRKGRCDPCYAYKKRTGQDRPEHLWKRVLFCIRCDCDLSKIRHSSKGVCINCLAYKNRTGKARPTYLFSRLDTAVCRNLNCQIPLRMATRVSKGYCSTCYWYLNAYKKQRSKKLACPGDVGLGWCACGHIATKVKAVAIGVNPQEGFMKTYHLCRICYDLDN